MNISQKKRILVADDEPLIINLLNTALSQADYDVFAASSGTEAVEVATTNKIDLAILDYEMPGMTGLEAGEMLHSLTSTRFILMSIHCADTLVDQASGAGVLAYIVKPLKIDDVLRTLKVQLERAAELKELNMDIVRAVKSARTVNTAVGIIMERCKIPRDMAYKHILQQSRRGPAVPVEKICDVIISTSEASYQLISLPNDSDHEHPK